MCGVDSVGVKTTKKKKKEKKMKSNRYGSRFAKLNKYFVIDCFLKIK